jgi:hypothetical protein
MPRIPVYRSDQEMVVPFEQTVPHYSFEPLEEDKEVVAGNQVTGTRKATGKKEHGFLHVPPGPAAMLEREKDGPKEIVLLLRLGGPGTGYAKYTANQVVHQALHSGSTVFAVADGFKEEVQQQEKARSAAAKRTPGATAPSGPASAVHAGRAYRPEGEPGGQDYRNPASYTLHEIEESSSEDDAFVATDGSGNIRGVFNAKGEPVEEFDTNRANYKLGKEVGPFDPADPEAREKLMASGKQARSHRKAASGSKK